MSKRKICIIITTRGNYAKMKSVISALETDDSVEVQLVGGGGAVLPKYGKIVDTMKNNNLPVDRQVHFLVDGENPISMSTSAGLAVIQFSTLFESMKPDLVVVIADRFECLAMAMAAVYMNIPIAHIEGGEISGSIDESIRHAITKLAHLHFPCTEASAKRIETMGEHPHTIHNVGATSLDVIRELNLHDLSPFDELQDTQGVGEKIPLNEPYLVVSQHAVTTEYEQNHQNISKTLEAIEAINMNAFWIWPNMDAGADGIARGIRQFRERGLLQRVHFFKSLPIELYAPLIKNAACVVGNTSSGVRESAFLGVPCVNIGTRQNGRERGHNVLDVGYEKSAIINAIKQQLEHGPYEPDLLYGDGTAGVKIAKRLATAPLTLQKQNAY